MDSIRLRIDGMHCGACVRRVSQALRAVEGVEVQVEDAVTAEPAALASIAKAGYSAQVER